MLTTIGNVSDYIPDYQVTTVFTSAKNASDERGLTENLADLLRSFGWTKYMLLTVAHALGYNHVFAQATFRYGP